MPSNRPLPGIKSPVVTVLLAWLLPGAGHYWLGRKNRGVIVFATVLLCFLVGVAMNGPFFSPSRPATFCRGSSNTAVSLAISLLASFI